MKRYIPTLILIAFYALGVIQVVYVAEDKKTLYAVLVGFLAAACSLYISKKKED